MILPTSLSHFWLWKKMTGDWLFISYTWKASLSNPTITEAKDDRRYLGIGKALVAFAIKTSIDRGYNGTVVMEAKTDALLQHYIHDFGGVAVRSLPGAGAPSVLIADEAAKKIFLDFLEE